MADQLHRADVDAELERRRGDEGAQVAGTQARLDDAAPGGRQAAVVGRHQERGVDVAAATTGLVVGQALGQQVGHPLGHLPRVDEDERGAVVPGVLGDAVEDVRHLAAAHDGLELGRGELDGDIEVAGVAAVDDHRRRALRMHAGEQAGHQVERALGGRQADALKTAAALGHQRVEALQAQREVAAPLVAGERVHLVDDDRAHAAQQGARRRRGEQEVERLGRGDEEVGRLFPHGDALGGRGVAGAHGHA